MIKLHVSITGGDKQRDFYIPLVLWVACDLMAGLIIAPLLWLVWYFVRSGCSI